MTEPKEGWYLFCKSCGATTFLHRWYLLARIKAPFVVHRQSWMHPNCCDGTGLAKLAKA